MLYEKKNYKVMKVRCIIPVEMEIEVLAPTEKATLEQAKQQILNSRPQDIIKDGKMVDVGPKEDWGGFVVVK